MTAKRFPVWLRGWRGPPLAFQILGLLIGGLVVAQLVTLFLTMLLPPAPPSQYGLDDIAAVLRGAPATGDGAALQRLEQPGPPDLSGPGWLVSERSRRELAALVGVSESEVSLAFYTPLPFAGSALPPPRAPMADDGPIVRPAPVMYPDSGSARLYLAQAQAAPGLPVGSFPPGNRPDGRLEGAGPPRDGFPPGMSPGASPAHGSHGLAPSGDVERAAGERAFPAGGNALYRIDPTPLPGGGVFIPGDGGAAVPPLLQSPARASDQRTLAPGLAPGQGDLSAQGILRNQGVLPGEGALQGQGVLPGQGTFPGAGGLPGQGAIGAANGRLGGIMQMPPLHDPRAFAPPPVAAGRASADIVARGSPPVARAVPTTTPPVASPPPPASSVVIVPPFAVPQALPAAPAIDPAGDAITVTPPARSLFGFAPAPFVEGDFVAALKLADGRWAVVQPADQPFPNVWQRRLLLWFAVAFAIVAPLGWLFARRLVKPLAGFAAAAERLGRDPAATTVALDGPAEIGRAAHAFNLMQGRLRSFVDDRTAMVGAISHDLRTPLTRLRFRIEDVPDDQREGMLEEVAEMEAMITSVLEFIRGASTPNLRERLDLRALVDDVAEDAVMIGKDVTVERGEPALVEVDVLGMRRVLDNLLENAVKYGGRARVRLRTEPDAAVAEIFDDGPGLPDDELERVFEPFYRSEAARSSALRGSGLGLAVCRSITRAHGGDVRLMRSAEGFVAQVRVPLAYGSERPLVA